MVAKSRLVENRSRTFAVLAVCLFAFVAVRTWSLRQIETQETVDIPPFSFDLNTATLEELDLIPGVGGKMAADIIALRETLGGFGAVEDLQKIRGIKSAKLSAISPYVFVQTR